MLGIEQGDGNAGFAHIGQRLVPTVSIRVGDIDAADDYDFDCAVHEIGDTLLRGGRDLVSSFRIARRVQRGVIHVESVIGQRIDGLLVRRGIGRSDETDGDIRFVRLIMGHRWHAVLRIADGATGRRASDQ